MVLSSMVNRDSSLTGGCFDDAMRVACGLELAVAGGLIAGLVGGELSALLSNELSEMREEERLESNAQSG